MHPSSIGPFRIQRELGRGGMGLVLLAHDTRLDRQVAIKALPAHLAQDVERLARFQREAKLLASLNHPAVGAIYGLEESDGHRYLILEFIDGETLADLLARGPLPLDEALPIARQIAEALEVAHEKGIIHRDLKPSNVMVTASGAVKVLDFGLARTAEGPPSSTSAAPAGDSPTLTSPARHSPTIPGAIMGTAGYMSPEQARGKPVDKRSDIFSFGCVLYEMLAGAGPFGGETVSDSIGAVLHREPDWSRLPPGTPPRLRELLANCLAKDRHNRLHDIADGRLEIERALRGGDRMSADATPHAMPRRLGYGAAIAAGALGVALLGAGWLIGRALHLSAPQPPAHSYHLSTAVPAMPRLLDVVGIAPDARFLLYKAWRELDADSIKPGGVLALRRLDRDETLILEATEGAMEAALSPDGRSIAFVAARDRAQRGISLRKLTLEDGRPIGTAEALCDLPAGGASSICWSSEREIVVAMAWAQTILAVPSAGGEPRVVLREEGSKEIDNWGFVRPLQPGKSILASRWALVGQTIKERTEVVELATGARTPLLQNAGGAMLVAGGGDGGADVPYVLARRNLNTLVAARMDLDTLEVVGEPVIVWSGSLRGSFFVSDSGTLVVTPGASDVSGRRLAWIDDQGRTQPLTAPSRPYGEIAVSPDGSRIASNLELPDQVELLGDLWIHDLSRGTSTRLPTQGPAWEFVWSRDGERIAYSSVTKEEFSIWARRVDGAGEAVKLHAGASAQTLVFPMDWSPDGKVLAVLRVDLAKGAADILMLEQEEESGPWVAKAYLDSPAGEDSLRFSPDGKWVQISSNESGRSELYVQPFTGAGSGVEDARRGRVQVSTSGSDGGGWWSADGTEIRYVDGERRLMSVQVRTEPNFSASVPKVLANLRDIRARDISFAPDGRLFVVLESDDERPNRIDVVIDFLAEVRARTGAGK